MPGPSRAERIAALQREVRASRTAFYRRMVVEAAPSARRLEQVYKGTLPALEKYINNSIREIKSAEAAPFGLNALKEQIIRELNTLSAAIGTDAAHLQLAGAEAGYRAGLAALLHAGVGAAYNLPTLEAIQAGLRYVDSPAFQAVLMKLAPYHAEEVANLIISGIAQGLNPREVARLAVRYFTDTKLPLVDALRLTRTTQIYAAREGTRSIYERTGTSHWIWSAAIGSPKTCLACIVMHGTIHPVSEPLSDHHQGRCAMTPLTPTWKELGFNDGQDVPIMTGIDWFNAQPASVQQQIMGPHFYEAWQAGLFQLTDVPKQYMNAIFGLMTRKATLAELTIGQVIP